MQYLELVASILASGSERRERTGVGTRAIHGATMRFDLSDGALPLLTTKAIRWEAVAHELLWFLSGETHIQPLLEHRVHIWTDWPLARYKRETGDNLSRDEFEERILSDGDFSKKWGSIGPGYGKQWRRWIGVDGRVHDQVADVIDNIRKHPHSRRLLWHAWNVGDLDKMALPPCHLLYQFFVNDDRLSLTLYQRSCDMGLGVPYNIASCGLLLRWMAEQCNLEPGEFFWVGHDVHVYLNHEEPLRVQLTRVPRPFPKLELDGTPPERIEDNSLSRLSLIDYHPHPGISMKVAV